LKVVMVAPLLPSTRSRIDDCISRIQDRSGEGRLTFLRTYEDGARIAADACDKLRQVGIETPPLCGMPISIKDLFDVKDETTLAGSKILTGAPPADRDAEVVRRLRRAGAIIVGKTNMTEFAFSGLGINPHYGTPANRWDRTSQRIPGGSSSGAPISITDLMAVAAIGTDTGGSVRIPAALCGIVGFKPTARTVPLHGALPLSSSFDSIGPLAKDVATCAAVFGVISAIPVPLRSKARAGATKLLAISNYVTENLDAQVARAYGRAISRLSSRGFEIAERRLPVLDRLPDLFDQGGIVAAEAYQWHEKLLARGIDAYDPRVGVRILRGSKQTAAFYLKTQQLRRELIVQWVAELEDAEADAVLAPTVPLIAPKIDDLADDDAYSRTNLLMLRNPTVVNALDGCAISLPCHEPDQAPVGLMLAGAGGSDRRLLSIAARVEEILSDHSA
jgi:aspartyl-tRNA(Asn)/glutamyl-tRNA(Gln) amidotransferase subunit A